MHGFEVDHYCHLKDDQMINLINEKVNHEKCKSIDAFVLYIHSRGIADLILCSNNKTVRYEIIQEFNNEICKNLINKPKIIFFDCRRNGELNYI